MAILLTRVCFLGRTLVHAFAGGKQLRRAISALRALVSRGDTEMAISVTEYAGESRRKHRRASRAKDFFAT
jgi:hypothetical protein